ncbi:alpha/beta hydrolase [Streptomyces sp. B15]|uniref:alpha/beta fold hydrolase n=1 Tax=Streptomyces sp. B15 TaxID=1537797 RepID=UPI0027DDA5E8|nr:alpha/beta hydrolase [Streptomyces sp. B15]
MKKVSTAAVALTLSVAAVAGGIGFTAGASQAEATKKPKPVVQDAFDPLGPPMHQLRHAGRTVHYSDTGEKGGTPVLFLGGTGTTARVSGMTEFLRTTRQKLGLRLVSVERNGFGDTEFDPGLGFADYTSDVRAVLDKLGVRKAPVVAISGGGPYAAHFAAAAPERVSSLHLAAALPPYGDKPSYCGKSDKELKAYFREQIRDPRKWWAFPEDSPVRRIPGFTDTAEEDGARSYYLRGQLGDPSAQVHEQKLYCRRPGPDLSHVKAPAYVYTGTKDTAVRGVARDPGPLEGGAAPKAGDAQLRRQRTRRAVPPLGPDTAGHGRLRGPYSGVHRSGNEEAHPCAPGGRSRARPGARCDAGELRLALSVRPAPR